jgi:prepilin peptidase CpaA
MRIDMTEIILIFILGTAIASDLRWRKIPNWLTGPSVLVGLGLHTFINQWTGLVFSLEGAVLGLGLFLVIYLLGWMGAGDVKLFAAVGSILGPTQTVSAALAVALVGGLLSLSILVFSLGWRSMGLWLWSHLQTLILTRSFQRPDAPVQGAVPMVPYAVPIGLGTIWSYWWYPLG